MIHIERAQSSFNDRYEFYENCAKQTLNNYEIDEYFQYFENHPESHKQIPGNLLQILIEFNQYCLGTGQDRELQTRLLKHYHTLAKSFFKIAYNEGKEVEVNFTGTPVKHIGREYKSGVGFNDWLKAWGVFTVFDDREGLELLQSIPESVMEKSNMSWDYLDKSMLSILQNIYNPNVKMGELILEAMRATDPKVGGYRQDNEAQEWVLYNYEPLIRVYEALFRRNVKDFNETLIEALELHKKFWGDEKSGRNNDSDAWISWLLLAPAATAVRFGMKLEVTSDYIPEWLVNGLEKKK